MQNNMCFSKPKAGNTRHFRWLRDPGIHLDLGGFFVLFFCSLFCLNLPHSAAQLDFYFYFYFFLLALPLGSKKVVKSEPVHSLTARFNLLFVLTEGVETLLQE